MRVLVTRAKGHVGSAVFKRLNGMNGWQAVGNVRNFDAVTEIGAPSATAGDISKKSDWTAALRV